MAHKILDRMSTECKAVGVRDIEKGKAYETEKILDIQKDRSVEVTASSITVFPLKTITSNIKVILPRNLQTETIKFFPLQIIPFLLHNHSFRLPF